MSVSMSPKELNKYKATKQPNIIKKYFTRKWYYTVATDQLTFARSKAKL